MNKNISHAEPIDEMAILSFFLFSRPLGRNKVSSRELKRNILLSVIRTYTQRRGSSNIHFNIKKRKRYVV